MTKRFLLTFSLGLALLSGIQFAPTHASEYKELDEAAFKYMLNINNCTGKAFCIWNKHLTPMHFEILARDYPQIEALQIINSTIASPLDVLVPLVNFRHLALQGCQLSAVPQAIAQMHQLRELVLTDNRITVLPDFITNMTSLVLLDLMGSGIRTLPQNIGLLRNLETLRLSVTFIETLPQSIGQLSKLKTLEIDSTKITTLPNTFTNLMGLESLRLSHLNHYSDPLRMMLYGIRQVEIVGIPNSITVNRDHMDDYVAKPLRSYSLETLEELVNIIYYSSNIQSIDFSDPAITAIMQILPQPIAEEIAPHIAIPAKVRALLEKKRA